MMEETVLLRPTPENIHIAAECLRAGEIVAIPTETVYGLAANALDTQAVRKIFEAKGRPQDNPLIVHISDMEMLPALVREIPDVAKRLAQAYWSGPLTMIFPKSDLVPAETSGGLDTVAVRMPAHPVAQQVIRAAGLPLAAPSANLSGKPSPTQAQHVRRDLQGKIRYVIDGGTCRYGVESTVISLQGDTITLLRPGAVTPQELSLFGNVQIADAVLHQLKENERVLSPGMKYRHYAPRARVTIVEGSFQDYCRYLSLHAGEGVWGLVFDGEAAGLPVPALEYGAQDSPLAQAQHLFDCLRQLDETGAQVVYARTPAQEGIGLAVYNRLLRAAAFSVVDAAAYQEVQP